MSVTERTPLTRRRVADAALALIDEHGLEQLSMRKLGTLLGVEAMALYNHVANKDDLLAAVADDLYAKVLVAYGDPTGTWRARAHRMADSYASVATAHPHAFELMVHRPITTPDGLEFLDRVLAIFDDVTADLRTAALAFSVASNWVVGTLVQSHEGSLPLTDEQVDLPAGYERVARFRVAMEVGLSSKDRFAEGFEAVLDGIEARYLS